LCWRSLSRRWK